jgi:hypothetical protein
MEITLRKLNSMFLQRKRASGKTQKWDAVLRPLWRHKEVSRNDLLARKSGNRAEINLSKWQAGGKARFIYLPPGYNNDPCMLRHTAGCSFYQGQCIDEVVHLKSSLIDLETYCEQEAA